MLEDLGWMSINQLCAETRLLEAWKTVNTEDYCLKESVPLKKRAQYTATRSNDTTLLELGPPDKFANCRFAHKTAQLWNEAPKEIKNETKLTTARSLIREFCLTLPT